MSATIENQLLRQSGFLPGFSKELVQAPAGAPGCEPDAKTKRRRAQKMLRTLRKLGYQVAINTFTNTELTRAVKRIFDVMYGDERPVVIIRSVSESACIVRLQNMESSHFVLQGSAFES